MKLCIAALGFLFFSRRAEAQQRRCDVYFIGGSGIMALDKTSAETREFKHVINGGNRIALDKDNGKLIYSTNRARALHAIGLDGTGYVALPFDGVCWLGAIAVDPMNDRVFSSCYRNFLPTYDSLLVGPSDGSRRLEWKLALGAYVEDVTAIAYDATNKKMFVAVQQEGVSEREYYIWAIDTSSKGGTPDPTILYETDYLVGSIDIDTSNGYIYWTGVSWSSSYNGVFRAPIDGSGPQEKLYSEYDFVGVPHVAKIDVVNQVLYIATGDFIYLARADGKQTPQVRYNVNTWIRDMVVDCDGSRDGLPLLAQCSSNEECFFDGICTGRVGKQKKCRFCARKNQVCDSHDDCCQSPSGRYCHQVEKVCKRRP